MGRGDKGRMVEGGTIRVWHIIRTFVNATMYPYPAQQ
jgi:hypothetical protein